MKMGTQIFLSRDDPDYQITDHFSTREFRCPCCRELRLDADVCVALEQLRAEAGRMLAKDTPLTISSGYRCPVHNAEVKDAVKDSEHTRGVAADVITPAGMHTRTFAAAAWQLKLKSVEEKTTGIRRVGCYDGYQGKYGFIHISTKKHWIAPDRWGNV